MPGATIFWRWPRLYLAEGNLLQASVKGWGPAAQMVKAVAEARGWRHQDHCSLYSTVNRLISETSDDSLNTQFAVERILHTNFYEGWLPRETVEQHLSQVVELVDKLEALRT